MMEIRVINVTISFGKTMEIYWDNVLLNNDEAFLFKNQNQTHWIKGMERECVFEVYSVSEWVGVEEIEGKIMEKVYRVDNIASVFFNNTIVALWEQQAYLTWKLPTFKVTLTLFASNKILGLDKELNGGKMQFSGRKSLENCGDVELNPGPVR